MTADLTAITEWEQIVHDQEAGAEAPFTAMSLREARMWLAAQIRSHLTGDAADRRCEIADLGSSVRGCLRGRTASLYMEVPKFTPCPEWAWAELVASVRYWCGSKYADGHLSHKEAASQAIGLPADMGTARRVLHADDLTLALLACGWAVSKHSMSGPSEFTKTGGRS